MPLPILSRVRVVLVEPQYGGNIGQCARAMINTGLARLVLVNPREHLTDEAFWMAREGRAIVEGAEVVASLAEALRPVGLAVATTRRIGKYRQPDGTPREAAGRIVPLLAAGNEVALVFGREDFGLRGEELDLCQWIVSIPASDDFPSLNLAQAVLVCAYELFLTASADEEPVEAAEVLAGPEKLERFYEHLHDVLTEIRFLIGDQAPAVFRSLRRLFGRAALQPREVKMLHGVLGQVGWFRNRALAVTPGPVIRWAAPEEFPAVGALLIQCGLSPSGLLPPLARISGASDPAAAGSMALPQRLLVAKTAGELAGCVALECAEAVALLRSLAVAPGQRGSGLGRRLVAEARDEARRCGCAEVYLLTLDAADWFARWGFERVQRDRFPESLRASAQWQETSCEPATVMRLAFAIAG